MGFTYQASASASAGVSYGPQLSLSSHMPRTIPPLTTIFTPPPECKTPFAFVGDCYNEFECDGSYMPFLSIPDSRNPGGTSIQCYPEVTTYSDGYVDAVFEYSPGLFCPDGMTTATSIASVFLCCPSGLTYSFDGDEEQCTATITMGAAFVGPWQQNQATVLDTTSFSSADSMTLYAAAFPVYLNNIRSGTSGHAPGQSIPPVSGESSTTGTSTLKEVPSKTPTSNSPRCRRDSCQTTTTTQPNTGGESTPATTNTLGSDEPKSSNQTNLKIGVGVGVGVGGAVVLILLALGYMLLRRYRRKRLLNPHQHPDSPPTKRDGDEAQEIQQMYRKKLPSELPVPESWVELEGTQVEGRGPGIYVWKPELEGTAGVPAAKGVYVRKKSELEARYYGAANAAPETGVVTYPDSPIIAASFVSPGYPARTAGMFQTYT
ncbi:hypothetical protein F5B21DRAFT_159304 [Xylaria acuta]|nr:hypothetical protein F5B21DRAFT_159304 [Xylaria acuta]